VNAAARASRIASK